MPGCDIFRRQTMTSKYGPRAERFNKTLTEGTKSVHMSIAINFTFDVSLNYKLSLVINCVVVYHIY